MKSEEEQIKGRKRSDGMGRMRGSTVRRGRRVRERLPQVRGKEITWEKRKRSAVK